MDRKILKLYMHNTEIENLVSTGYYPKIKHILDRYEQDGKYLMQTEIFPNLILLYYTTMDSDKIDIEKYYI